MSKSVKTIKVGTFNLNNLLLPETPVYSGSLKLTDSEFEAKSNWTNFMLNQMDADIIGFQELFHKEALMRIIRQNDKYKHADVIMADETGEQPHVAILSKFPIENFEVYSRFPDEAIVDIRLGNGRTVLPFNRFTRPVLKADIRIPGFGLITYFVAHLKSKRPKLYEGEDENNPVDLARSNARSLMMRAAESVALRTILVETLQSNKYPVVVVGDVNDTGSAVTSRIISGEVPQHRLPDTVKRGIWDVLLYHVKDIQARRSYQDFYYTHIHNGMYESLDHIMVSQELVTENPKNIGRVGLVSVYNDHIFDQTFTNEKVDKAKTDHGVVVASLELFCNK